MKTFILSILILGFTSAFALANNEKFVKAMEQALIQLNSVQGSNQLNEWQTVANQFERINKVETKEWLPGYYVAYCYVRMAYIAEEDDQKDKYVELAEDFCDNALKISKNDELYALRAMIAQASMSIKPAIRWMTQGKTVSENLENAKKLNPNNPRVYFLEGNSIFYKPETFGGGAKNACPLYKKAMEKFATFAPASSIAPNWGKEPTAQMLKKCD